MSESSGVAAREEAAARNVTATLGQKVGGSIELIIGPMFSEKTSEMVSRVRRGAFANQPALIIKWRGDTRYTDGAVVASHSDIRQSSTKGSETCAPIRVVTAELLRDVVIAVGENTIGIDEGQFYPDLIEMCEQWAASGIRVIVAALDGDFARRPFGQVCSLVPLCESVEKRRGVCMNCRSRDSAFTQRLGSSTDLIVVGAGESYRSVCRTCYLDGLPR